MVNDFIDPMVPNRSKVIIKPKLAPAEWDSSERRSIDGPICFHLEPKNNKANCYKLIQWFRVTGLFAGQYNTKLHGTITDVL